MILSFPSVLPAPREFKALSVHKEKKAKRENRGFKVLQALRGKKELPGLRVPQESLPLLQ